MKLLLVFLLFQFEDSTPQIPVEIRLSLHRIDQLVTQIPAIHNERFKPSFKADMEFILRHLIFRAKWVGFLDTLNKWGDLYRDELAVFRVGEKRLNPELSHIKYQLDMLMVALLEDMHTLKEGIKGKPRKEWESVEDRLEQLKDELDGL